MAKLPDGLKVEKTEISQTIDLQKWTGKDLSSDPELVREIGQEVIDYMIKRSADNKGLGEVQFKPPKYSKTYADSLNFIAAGKSPTDVNMRLSGDMLGSIDMNEEGNKVTIEIGEDQTLKAYGHMTGYEGHPTIPNGKYKRQFFGITKTEFDKNILPKFKNEIPKKSREDLQGELINRIRNTRDLFGTEEDLQTQLYKDLLKLIEEL